MIDAATIAAIATPAGSGAIGIVRMSGPEAAAIASQVFRRGRSRRKLDLGKTASHRLIYGQVVDPAGGEPIDEALLGWMAAPHTYTGEDTVELYGHGGPVPLQETLRAVLAAGARAAEPGEFTLRAYLNGRLDLTQAEAVLQVVGARSAEGLRLAVDDLRGDLARRIAPARASTISLLAYLDAAADFPDDEIPVSDVDADLALAEATLAEIVDGSRAGMLYQDGARVALVGRPNVGKSSLLNALLRADRAIVTPIAGTTRDVIAETAVIAGIPVTLLDTAGIAETSDLIEGLGVERSHQALTAAAAAILVIDGSVPPQDDDLAVATLLRDRLAEAGASAPVVIAINKSDLPARADQTRLQSLLPDATAVPVSSHTGHGLPELEAALATLLRADTVSDIRPALITARQRAALDRALFHIQAATATRAAGYPLDLLAIDVRAAVRAIGSVTGEAIDDAVLTEIFSRFCIGK